MDSFFITLPSNVISTDSFKNRIGNYRTQLAKRVSLEGSWEIALNEISYTKSWYNFPSAETAYAYDFKNGTVYKLREMVSAGIYPTVKDLTTTIDNRWKVYYDGVEWRKFDKSPKFHYDPIKRSIAMTPGFLAGGHQLYPFFPKHLANALGFGDYNDFLEHLLEMEANKVPLASREEYWKDKPNLLARMYTGKQPVDLSGGYHSLFVYTDIADTSMVGDSLTKLLRVVEIPNTAIFGNQVVIKYTTPNFVPLLKKDFDTIEIDIKDDSGETVPFNFGRVIVTLQLRRVK